MAPTKTFMPDNWLKFGWNPRALIALCNECRDRGIDLDDHAAVRVVYAELVTDWTEGLLHIKQHMIASAGEAADIEDLLQTPLNI
jgi:hypothetical protein